LEKVPGFSGFLGLTELNVSHNKLKKLPTFRHKELVKLYLSHNQINEVPDFRLSMLKELDVSHNQIIKIPDFRLSRLGLLNLSDNLLESTPDFSRLKEYKGVIILSNNNFEHEIPFTHLYETWFIWLNDNYYLGSKRDPIDLDEHEYIFT